MSLIEYLDRTGKHVSAKTFEKYRDGDRDYSDWEALTNIRNLQIYRKPKSKKTWPRSLMNM